MTTQEMALTLKTLAWHLEHDIEPESTNTLGHVSDVLWAIQRNLKQSLAESETH
jgi:hypothetical protein